MHSFLFKQQFWVTGTKLNRPLPYNRTFVPIAKEKKTKQCMQSRSIEERVDKFQSTAKLSENNVKIPFTHPDLVRIHFGF